MRAFTCAAQAVTRALAQAGACRLVAGRLLEVEGRLPAEGALCCASFPLWHAWRRAVERADSPGELVPQVVPLDVWKGGKGTWSSAQVR